MTTPGAGNLTIPTGYEWDNVTVQCWGGGGGGGSGGVSLGYVGGGGGGGGAYAYNTYPMLPSGTFSYCIGTGGTAANGPDGSGGNGGDTIWDFGGAQDIYAAGGEGGYWTSGPNGGASGLVLDGTGYQGGLGGSGGGENGGGGGGSAGPSEPGGDGSGSEGNPPNGGSGGTGYGGGGAGGVGSGYSESYRLPAGAGGFPGGGGGGGGRYWWENDNAAPGGNGEIIITYTQEAVPEPSTLALFGVGGISLAVYVLWRHSRLVIGGIWRRRGAGFLPAGDRQKPCSERRLAKWRFLPPSVPSPGA